MVEFRTTIEEGPSKEESGSIEIEDIANQLFNNLQDNVENQLILAEALQESGIDPRLLSIVSPKLGKVIKQKQKQQEEKEAKSQSNKQKEIEEMKEESEEMKEEVAKAKEIEVEDMTGLLGDLIDVLPKGEETTLSEVEDLAEDNPDIMQTQIDMRLN